MKRITNNKVFSIIICTILVLGSNCKKEKEEQNLAILSSTKVSNISATSAMTGGDITSDGSSKITDRGVCWSTSVDPTISNSKTTDGSGIGKFTSIITGLTTGTTYHIRAYATNSVGTAYGNSITFTTKFAAPTVETTTLPIINSLSVVSGGNITSDGGQPIIRRGICWSPDHVPTIADDTTSDGTGTGNYFSKITDLCFGGTYYLRAYATSAAGTGYGNTLCFVLDFDGNLYHAVSIGTQTWMIENLKTTHYNNGSNIPNITDSLKWSNTKEGAYCDYNNDASKSAIYGHLYNWHVVRDVRRIAPYRWHIPSDAEWRTLQNYLGLSSAGAKLKEAGTVHWINSDMNATNESGFCALPGGQMSIPYTFKDFGYKAFFWSANYVSQYTANSICLISNKAYVITEANYNEAGLSIRCVQDPF